MTQTTELPIFEFVISGKMAQEKGIPTTFQAIIVRETPKAIFVKGHGILDARYGICAKCGRTLTHPGSIILGVGPECLKNWGLREEVLSDLTPEEIKQVGLHVEAMEVETWLPKYCVKEAHKTEKTQTVTPVEKPVIPARAVAQGTVTLKMTFAPSPELLAKVKSLPGRRYFNVDGQHYWTAPICPDTLRSLKEWGFELDSALAEILNNAPVQKTVDEVETVDVKGLKGQLRPFQQQGISFLVHRNGNAIIGDEMGLGKTVQALGFIHYCGKRPAVVVMPASLKSNWAAEVVKWLPSPRLTVLSGKKPTPLSKDADIILINYDVLDSWVDEIRLIRPRIVVLDECHYFKNNGAARTKAVKQLCKGVEHVIPLSGTPAINRPVEIYNAITLVEPGLFPSFMHFARKYCNAHHNGFGWDFTGASNLDELYTKLSSVMIRRKKADVLPELPAKTRTFVSMDLTNGAEYRKAENSFISWVRTTKGSKAAEKASNAEQLTQIAALRLLAAKGAVKNAIAWIKDFLDGSDQKLVVMAIHREIIDQLVEEFKTVSVKIDGSTPVNSRQALVERFQNDPDCRLFVGNIKAAGVGLTLTAASNVAFLELPWTPGELDQAEDRVHRIGQKNAVNIWYLLPGNTIEEELAETIDQKRQVLSATLDGTEVAEGSTLSALIGKYAA